MTALGFFPIANDDSNRVALVEPDGRRWTFGELAGATNQLSHALRGLGLERGDSIALLLPNGWELLTACLAANQLGLYFTAINWHLTGTEAGYIVTDSGARALLAHEQFTDTATVAADHAQLAEQQRIASGDIDGFTRLEKLLPSQPIDRPDDRFAGQPMLYTSGTTGRPKGVRRPLPKGDPDEAMALGAWLGALFDVPPGPGTHLVTGPLYHAAPLGFALGLLNAGQTLVAMDKWTPEETLRLVEEHQITNTHMVPTMFKRLVTLPAEVRDEHDLSSLQCVVHAAAPCPIDLKRAVIGWLGPIVYEYYGSTEGIATLVKPKDWLDRPGTVGSAIPGVEVKILDDERRECPSGTPGNVWVRSGSTAFEYHNDPDKTAANRLDGFITVGDIAYLDDEGWLFLCDRQADVIISGGVNIYPAEVEAVLLGDPAVADVAVIGIPDDEWGESVLAIVEPAAEVDPDDQLTERLMALCTERLARFKHPRRIEYRHHLPRHDTGKLYKRLLRDEYWQGQERRI